MTWGGVILVFILPLALFGLCVFAAIFLIVRKLLSTITRNQIAEAEARMSETSFVIRCSKADIWSGVISLLFWATFFLRPLTIRTGSIFFVSNILVVLAPFLLWIICLTLYRALWYLRIDGNKIYYRTLFRRKEFSFDDIERATVSRFRTILHLEKKEANKSFVILRKSVGHNVFLHCLKQRNIPVW